MRNLVKIEVVEVKASLNADAIKAIREELSIINKANDMATIKATAKSIYKIVNTCVNAAYQLGRIDEQKGQLHG